MEEVELDSEQVSFIRGWMAGRGVTGRPNLQEFSDALRALIDAGYMREAGEDEEYQAIRLQ